MQRKAPTPIRSTPSSAPLEAMVAKQQAHIDELVMKNRTLEQTAQKLKAEIETEKQRHDNNLQQIRDQLIQERAEWQDGCDVVQSTWRIIYLRTFAELEKVRASVLDMKEELRLAKLSRLRRDYQIGMFQAKELELENRVVQVQEQLGEALWAQEEFRNRKIQLKEQLQQHAEQLVDLAAERDHLQKSLTSLRSEHTSLVASSSASSTSLERAQLQVEGLTASLAESQAKNSELDRTSSDLRRQLEKWRNLDKREGAEVESLRKDKIELDVRVKEIEAELQDVTKLAKERDEKLQSKLQRYKASLAEHADALKERDEELQQKDGEIADFQEKLDESGQQIAVLAKQIDEEREKSRTLAKQAKDFQTVTKSPVIRPKPKAKPAFKPAAKPVAESSDEIEEVEHPPKPQLKAKTDTAAAYKFVDDEADEAEEVPAAPAPAKKDKPKAVKPTTAKPGPSKPVQAKAPSPDIEEVEPDTPPARRRAREENSEDEDAQPKKRRKGPDSGGGAGKIAPAKKVTKKPSVQTKSKARQEEQESDSGGAEVGVAQKKKKRKINIFPSTQTAFDWGPLSQGDGGLRIPTELSPVKEGAVVPPRSTSTLGKGLSSAFGRR